MDGGDDERQVGGRNRERSKLKRMNVIEKVLEAAPGVICLL